MVYEQITIFIKNRIFHIFWLQNRLFNLKTNFWIKFTRYAHSAGPYVCLSRYRSISFVCHSTNTLSYIFPSFLVCHVTNTSWHCLRIWLWCQLAIIMAEQMHRAKPLCFVWDVFELFLRLWGAIGVLYFTCRQIGVPTIILIFVFYVWMWIMIL